jgi:ABC-type uncharacterized transport system auxiliary subunit
MVKLTYCRLVVGGLLVSALSISGCGSMKPLPSDTYYRLNVDRASAENQQWTDKPIRVAKFQASGIHRERAIVHTESGKFSVNQHRYHLWIDSPERMLQHELISYLRAANVAPTISASNSHLGGFEVVGRVRQFEQVRDGTGIGAVVALDLELITLDSPRSVIVSQEYRENLSVGGDDIESTAAAMSAAIASIFERFVTEVSSALR